MKKRIVSLALLLIAIGCYAQKSNEEEKKVLESLKALNPSDLRVVARVRDNPQKSTVELKKFYIKGKDGVLKTNGPDDYYIIEYKGKKASELYTNVLSAVSALYKNPERVLSKVDNVSVKIAGTALDVPVPRDPKLINQYFPQKNDYYGFDYSLFFQFKDEKIRINAPIIRVETIMFADVLDHGRYDRVSSVFAGLHFFDSKDEITIAFENYLNELIEKIIKKSEIVNSW